MVYFLLQLLRWHQFQFFGSFKLTVLNLQGIQLFFNFFSFLFQSVNLIEKTFFQTVFFFQLKSILWKGIKSTFLVLSTALDEVSLFFNKFFSFEEKGVFLLFQFV